CPHATLAPTTLHLRSETKYLERRTPLTPTTTKTLLDAGYHINVEKSTGRVFRDDEYEAAGAQLVPEGSWIHAPKDNIIMGLKELPADDAPLEHAHIQFGHCYKKQENWDRYLSRFARGGGVLYDIEFLTDPSGKRVAAFGYYAGFAGAAVALLAWAHQLTNPGVAFPMVNPTDYPSQNDLIKAIIASLARAVPLNSSQPPRIIVVGALGRCGTGVVDCCVAAGVPTSSILKWDMAETAAGGPFKEIAASDIFINCIYLREKIPPFVTRESLSKPGRKLRVISDVSCDPGDPNNPVPLYTEYSTFTKPTIPLEVNGDGPDMVVISIDHLPSLVAKEASESFSQLLLPSLKALDRKDKEGVWIRAEQVFREKVQRATGLLN
ncbi:MAG: hypothetical protein L6R35_006950, partial [Caloplaca aegaea]